jgi:hypothetical protein
LYAEPIPYLCRIHAYGINTAQIRHRYGIDTAKGRVKSLLYLNGLGDKEGFGGNVRIGVEINSLPLL